jgi:predicted dehydrogenase
MGLFFKKTNGAAAFQHRRKFLKESALLTGGLFTAPYILKATDHQEEAPIKIALIGCGGRGTGAAIQALKARPNVQLVAMADAFDDNIQRSLRNIQRAANEAKEGNLAARIQVTPETCFAGFDGYTKAIAAADVVLLCTPPGFRPLHFEAAVKAGKHIFMEKPVATDTAGIKQVLETAAIAQQKKLNVVVGLQRRYQNSYKALAERKDLIGDITSAQAWWNNDGVWVRPRKSGQTEMEYQMRNWYYFNWLCGDHITEQHIHNIDVVNWFKNAYPIKAQGFGGRQVRKGKDHGEIFDHHFVEFEYADGTILNSQCRHMPGTTSKVDELLIGTKGKIFAADGLIKDRSGKVLFQFDRSKENNPYQTEHDLLFQAIATGKYQFADAEVGAFSTLTSIMGRMATYSGQTIEWKSLLEKPYSLMPETFSFDANPPVMPNDLGEYPVPIPGITKFS